MDKIFKFPIEKELLSVLNTSKIQKILDYISTLIVKVEIEAENCETEQSFNNYSTFESAYMGSKSIYSFKYTRSDLRYFFSNDEIDEWKLLNPNNINNLIQRKNPSAISFLNNLEKRFLNNYVEYNSYYKQFLGKPKDVDDVIYVQNFDLDNKEKEFINEYDYKKYICLHDVTLDRFPLTYEYYFLKRHIDKEIEKYPDLDYLKFIEKPISPYLLRKYPDYTILYSNENILDDDELMKFNKSYNKARIYVTEQLYAYGVARRLPIYGNLIYLCILYYTICNYLNLSLEDTALRRYSKIDIHNILISNNLKNLTKITNLELLKKVVFNLETLNQYKGSEEVLIKLFELLDDKNTTIRRLYLLKDYKTNNLGELEYDTSGLYNKTVDLKFSSEIISNNKIEEYEKKYIDYNSVTYFDDTWGGVEDLIDEVSIRQIKENVKKEILQTDFNSLSTKYLVISKSINMVEKSIDVMNIFYLVLKFYYDMGEINGKNPFVNDTINYRGMECAPITLIAAFCYLNNISNKLTQPWKISPDRNFLASIYFLRSETGLEMLLHDIKNEEIDIGYPILKRKMSEIFTESEIRKYLTKYNYNSYTTIGDILNQYEENKQIIELLKNKLAKEENEIYYESYLKLLKYNQGVYDFQYLFDNYTDYREYIQYKNPGLMSYLENIIRNTHSSGVLVDFKSLYEENTNIISKVEEFINILLEGEMYFAFNTDREDTSYLNDLKILANEFLSIYSEISSVDKSIEINDSPNNILKYLYTPLSIFFKNKFYDKIIYRYRFTKLLHKIGFFDNISYFSSLKYLFSEDFESKMEYFYSKYNIRQVYLRYDKLKIDEYLKNFIYKNKFNDNLNNIIYEFLNMEKNYKTNLIYKYELLDKKHINPIEEGEFNELFE